jgi:DNA repair exonuclease SbcCD ATPase subunit
MTSSGALSVVDTLKNAVALVREISDPDKLDALRQEFQDLVTAAQALTDSANARLEEARAAASELERRGKDLDVREGAIRVASATLADREAAALAMEKGNETAVHNVAAREKALQVAYAALDADRQTLTDSMAAKQKALDDRVAKIVANRDVIERALNKRGTDLAAREKAITEREAVAQSLMDEAQGIVIEMSKFAGRAKAK